MANGVFGPTGQEVFRNLQRERAVQAAQLGRQIGSIPIEQQAGALFGQAGALAGRAVGVGIDQAQGVVDPRVDKANRMRLAQQQVFTSGIDPSDTVAFGDALADAFAQNGLMEEARQAGQEADKARSVQVERDNVRNMLENRKTAQERRFELESRKQEGQLDRESRERIASLRTTTGGRTALPKVRRSATGTERKDAATVIESELPDQWAALSKKEREDISSFVAGRARDIAAENPGTDFQDAQLVAIQEAAEGLSGEARFGVSALGGVDFARPGAASPAAPAQALPQKQDPFSGFSIVPKG